MSDNANEAFDAPIVEPVNGIGDVQFARADMDYWSAWAEQIRQDRVAKDLAALATVPMLDPMRRVQERRKIEDQIIQIAEAIDRRMTGPGLKKILLDAMTRAGRSIDEAKNILRRIGPGRQMQLAEMICSEPQPTIEGFRDAIRKSAAKSGMPAHQIAQLTDDDLIRLAGEYRAPATSAEELKGQAEASDRPLAVTPESTGNAPPPSSATTSPAPYPEGLPSAPSST